MRLVVVLLAMLANAFSAGAQTANISDIRVVDGRVWPGEKITISYEVEFDRSVEFDTSTYRVLGFSDGSGTLGYRWSITGPDNVVWGGSRAKFNASNSQITSGTHIVAGHTFEVVSDSLIECGISQCLPIKIRILRFSPGQRVVAEQTELVPVHNGTIDDSQVAVNPIEEDHPAMPVGEIGSGQGPLSELSFDWGITNLSIERTDLTGVLFSPGDSFLLKATLTRSGANPATMPGVILSCVDSELETRIDNTTAFNYAENPLEVQFKCRVPNNLPESQKWYTAVVRLRSLSDEKDFDADQSNNLAYLEIPIYPKEDGLADVSVNLTLMDQDKQNIGFKPGERVKAWLSTTGTEAAKKHIGDLALIIGEDQYWPDYDPIRTSRDSSGNTTLIPREQSVTITLPDFEHFQGQDSSVHRVEYYLTKNDGDKTYRQFDNDPTNDRGVLKIRIDVSGNPGADDQCQQDCYARCEETIKSSVSNFDAICTQSPQLTLCSNNKTSSDAELLYCKRSACRTPEAEKTCQPSDLPISRTDDPIFSTPPRGISEPDGAITTTPDSEPAPIAQEEDDIVVAGSAGSGAVATIPPRCRWNACGWGDPHLVSFDGVAFDFQGVGEFWLARSEDHSIGLQARMEPYGRNVSVISAISLAVGDDEVAIYSNRDVPIFLNGSPLELQAGIYNAYTAPSDLYIVRTGARAYEIVFPNNMKLRVTTSSYLNFDIMAPDMSALGLTGLLGSADGRPSNDFGLPDGEYIPHSRGNIGFDDLYKRFGNSWRISQEESLFIYADGESTETFTDLDYPAHQLTIDDLPDEDRERAAKICRDAGIINPRLLETCIYDVGFTGDASFTNDYAEMVAAPPQEITRGPATLSAPARVEAGSAVTARWTGPANEGDFISFASPDQAGGQYESYDWAKPGSNSVLLVAPGTPGEYELRYVLYTDREIMTRRQIMVTAAEAILSAPARVEAGAAITVEWTGPANRGDFISLARPDQTGGRYETYDWAKPGGAPVTLTSPEEPGTYELRYILYSDRMIVARIPIVVE